MRANKIRDLLADSYCEDEDTILELDELERLARIGKATELAFQSSYEIQVVDYKYSSRDKVERWSRIISCGGTSEFVSWIESEKR